MVVELNVIGEVTAKVDGEEVNLGPARQRCVLAVLAVEANRLVPADQLADRVWGDGVPYRAAGTLRSYLSRLRTALATGDGFGIQRRAGGYLLSVDESAVDLYRFRLLLSRARDTTDDDHAAALFEDAFTLWRGDPFAGLDSPWLDDVRNGLAAEHLAARLDFHDVQLRRGRHTELSADLLALTAEHPWHERLAAQAMLALYRSGRQAGALSFYEELRVRLGAELGVDPSTPLRELHQRILTSDPAIAPARAADSTVPRQLPAVPRAFTGRARELSELDSTDTRARVSLLAGVGGVGKTWLALRWAHDNAHRFPDGQLYVNLRGFDPRDEPMTPETALRGFLAGLGVPSASVPASLDELSALFRSLVADKQVLVVLDNARDSAQVLPLLPGGTGCSVVVTSRNRLTGVMSSAGALPVALDVLSTVDAREVLAAHVGGHRVAAEPGAAGELLGFCAGLPLALGIVAARANTQPAFPLSAFAEELRSSATRLDMLDHDDTTSLRHVLSWSHRALSPSAATVFARLGALPAAEFGEAAAASAGALPVASVRPLMRELSAAHLVTEYAPRRYRMHDLVRLYATELVAGEGPGPLKRVLDHYLRTAYAAALVLKPHRQPIEVPAFDEHAVYVPLASAADAMAWFVRESAALIAAVTAADTAGYPAHVWQLVWTMTDFFERHGQWRDYIATAHVALSAAVRLRDTGAQARARRTLGRAHIHLGEYDTARGHQERAVVLYAENGDLRALAHMEIGIGQLWVRQGEHEKALAHALRGLAVHRQIGHHAGEATALNAVGWCEAQLGRYADAEEHCRASLALHQEVADRHGQAGAWDSLGYVLMRTGRHEEAVTCFEESLTLARELRDRASEGEALDHLGDAHEAMGDHARAETSWQSAMAVLEELDPAAAKDLRAKLAAHT